jgi:hypothetical protein
MNENELSEEDGLPINEDANGEQLELPIPPADGMSLGEWIEWMPKDTQYRSRRLTA